MAHYKIEQLRDGELIEFLATMDKQTLDMFKDFFADYESLIQRLNISEKGISPDDPTIKIYNERYKKEGLNIKIVPSNIYSSNVGIEIGKTFVKFYDLKNIQGLIIENAEIAKSLRQIFEMAWKGAKAESQKT